MNMKKKCLPAILALYLVSPLIMANDQQPVIELTSAQMDSVTAGAGESFAIAGAGAAGLGAASATETNAFVFEQGGYVVAAGGAGAVAAGDDPSAQTSATTGTGGVPSSTFEASINFQGNVASFSTDAALAFPNSFPQ